MMIKAVDDMLLSVVDVGDTKKGALICCTWSRGSRTVRKDDDKLMSVHLKLLQTLSRPPSSHEVAVCAASTAQNADHSSIVLMRSLNSARVIINIMLPGNSSRRVGVIETGIFSWQVCRTSGAGCSTTIIRCSEERGTQYSGEVDVYVSP